MKIYAFEVRNDEIASLVYCSEQYNIELKISQEVPTINNAKDVLGYDGVTILGQGKINRELLSLYHDYGVKYLTTRTIGYDHIDLQAAKEFGIQVCNASYPPNGVADFTVMMILMCLRNFKEGFWRGYVNDFSLKGLQGKDLNSCIVGVLGTGKIGKQVIKNLSGFGCKILAYDLYENEEVKQYATYTTLEEIYQKADIITLHMPLLPETKHIINHESIAKMKDGIIIINCARGELACIEALVEGIESQKIGALGIDTLEGEQGIIHQDRRSDIISNRNWFYLHQFRNVIMTQHMAFYTVQAVESMVLCGIEGIVEMSKGQKYKTQIV